ncbi:MAG: hypothetical protein HQK83_18565 [Fibrobacteria bacterium]|nr:hypothetical protein [Fibrobacteria bacterium]
MKGLKRITLITILACLGITYSQTILLKGKIVDKTGVPVAGAVTSLQKAGLSDTTDGDGKFTISNYNTTEIHNNQALNRMGVPVINNGYLLFSISESKNVSIDIFTVNGHKLTRLHGGRLAQGAHRFPITSKIIEQGVYLVKAEIGKNVFTAKYVHTGSFTTSSVKFESHSLGHLAKTAAGVDSLIVSIDDSVYTSLEVETYIGVLPDIVVNLDKPVKSMAFEADSNTVALWHFDEGEGGSFKNEMGGNGSLFGGNGVTWVDGKFGKAVHFDGASGYGNANINPPENNCSYEMWYKPDNPPATTGVIWIGWGQWNSGLGAVGDSVHTGFFADASGKVVYPIEPDQWNYIVMNYSPNPELQGIWVNGEKLANLAVNNTKVVPRWDKLYLGAYEAGGKMTYHSHGTIDEFRISNRPRTEEEIKKQWGRTDNETDSTFTDNRDGTEYKKVVIGEQTWMAENLRYKTEANDAPCYNNQEANCDTYGRLYTSGTALADNHGNGQDVCPAGWHIPTKPDWDELMQACGNDTIAGTKLRTEGVWPGVASTDDYGFNYLPAGFVKDDGQFYQLGAQSMIWLDYGSSNVWYLPTFNAQTPWVISWGMASSDVQATSYKFSVRCVRDN